MLVDPDGRKIMYGKNNTLAFNIGTKLRIFWQSLFGTKEVRCLIKQLKTSTREVHIIESKNGLIRNMVLPKTYSDYLENKSPKSPVVLDLNDETFIQYERDMENFEKNKPTNHSDGSGDGSYVYIDYSEIVEGDGEFKQNKWTTLFHELFHAKRIDDGEAKERETEEIKAVEFVNRNFRSEGDKRKEYEDWIVE